MSKDKKPEEQFVIVTRGQVWCGTIFDKQSDAEDRLGELLSNEDKIGDALKEEQTTVSEYYKDAAIMKLQKVE